MSDAFESRYTGIFTETMPIPPRPHDPGVHLWAGELAQRGGGRLACGGAGWEDEGARAALLGEGIERFAPAPVPQDATVSGSFAAFPLHERAVDPASFVLFHEEQYARPTFPFERLTRETTCAWVAFRDATTGEPVWVPEDLAFLGARGGARHRFAPTTSSGLACGTLGQPILLRGLEELIERDGVLGAWWGRYELEEHETSKVLALVGEAVPQLAERILRPNLEYRFFRVATPFSAHVTLVTLGGDDHEGWVWSTGSACRETRGASWAKSLLEAIQGRHHVRHLLAGRDPARDPRDPPASFAEHALYYSLNRDQLGETVLARAVPPAAALPPPRGEGIAELRARLGGRPVLFRNVTPPEIASEVPGWLVLRVLVPGLQPLHGHHELPHLGGPLWAPRGLGDYRNALPHPFA